MRNLDAGYLAKRKRGKFVVAIVGLLAVATLVVGVSPTLQQPSSDSSDRYATGGTEAPSGSFALNDRGHATVSIPTQYGNLWYPAEFEAHLETESDVADGFEAVIFSAVLPGRDAVRLFVLCFGDADGTKIGEMDTSNGKVPVYLFVDEVGFDNSWEDDEIDEILGMQESLNVVIDSLEANPSFHSELG